MTRQAALRELFFALCEAYGLSVSRDARIPSTAEAGSQGFRALVGNARDSAKKLTDEPSSDLSAKVIRAVPPKNGS